MRWTPSPTSRWTPGALDQAQAIARHLLERWLNALEPQAAALYQEVERRFVELLDGVCERLQQLQGLEDFSQPRPAASFRVKSGVFYTEMLRVAPTSPTTWVLDHAFPRWRRRAVQRAASTYQRRLLEVNSARVKNDFEDRLTSSRRALERDMRQGLQGLRASAETALGEARRAHAQAPLPSGPGSTGSRRCGRGFRRYDFTLRRRTVVWRSGSRARVRA